MKAYLILEDGHVFTGQSFGSPKEAVFEVVFNTSMTGYVELLTDPSYAGQGVVMTYPLIGNYGFCHEDCESEQPWVSAFILREMSRVHSNFRSEGSLEDFLIKFDIPGIQGIDTRVLTKILRNKGTMNAMITTEAHFDLESCLARIAAYRHEKLVERVTLDTPKVYDVQGKMIALLDFGVKNNIIKCLGIRGFSVTVFPAHTTANEILAANPAGIMLGNGPGDPASCGDIIPEIVKLIDAGLPTLAICLGHQLAAIAAGGKTHKLKYGHRGANHPVRDMATGRSYITAQNHGYCVDSASIDPAVAAVSFENVNDGTCEGLLFKNRPVITVQFHPEASSGPQETSFIFDQFFELIESHKPGL